MNMNSQQLRKQQSVPRVAKNRQGVRLSLISLYNTGSIERKTSVTKSRASKSFTNVKFRKMESVFRTPVDRVLTHPDAPLADQSGTRTLLVEVVYRGFSKVIEFEYNSETKIRQLTDRIKIEMGAGHLLFRSGILTVDHLLTLNHQRVSEFGGDGLQLIATDLKTLEAQPNSLKHFTILKCIGSGGFSKVFMSECYGVFMALKIINKQRVVNDQKHAVIQNQKSILLQFHSHPFITKLHYSIETQHTIVFAMEFCSGGQLFHLLKKVRRMVQHQARFYFMEVLSALIALHQQNIVYRDLKPENIVIDSDGHVRLADFGLSKRCKEGIANNSFCGSAEYMAPQMIQRKTHGIELDVYCLGALLYELIIGLPPFFSRQSDKMFHNIVHQPIIFPPDILISKNAKKLMLNLLNKDPKQRMSAVEILKDPWLKGATLEKINSKQYVPPFKPSLLAYNFQDAEFAHTEADDMVSVFNEKENGDLVLPLLRKFYFESDFMKNYKQKLKTPPDLKVPSKRPSAKKTSLINKLRTESNSSQTACPRRDKPKRSPLNPRQNNNSVKPSRKPSPDKTAWLLKALQQQKTDLQKQTKSGFNIKKSYRNRQFMHKLYAAR